MLPEVIGQLLSKSVGGMVHTYHAFEANPDPSSHSRMEYALATKSPQRFLPPTAAGSISQDARVTGIGLRSGGGGVR